MPLRLYILANQSMVLSPAEAASPESLLSLAPFKSNQIRILILTRFLGDLHVYQCLRTKFVIWYPFLSALTTLASCHTPHLRTCVVLFPLSKMLFSIITIYLLPYLLQEVLLFCNQFGRSSDHLIKNCKPPPLALPCSHHSFLYYFSP